MILEQKLNIASELVKLYKINPDYKKLERFINDEHTLVSDNGVEILYENGTSYFIYTNSKKLKCTNFMYENNKKVKCVRTYNLDKEVSIDAYKNPYEYTLVHPFDTLEVYDSKESELFPEFEYPKLVFSNNREIKRIEIDDCIIGFGWDRYIDKKENNKIISRLYYDDLDPNPSRFSKFIYNNDNKLLYIKNSKFENGFFTTTYITPVDESKSIIAEKLIIEDMGDHRDFKFTQYFKNGYCKISNDNITFEIDNSYYEIEIPWLRGITPTHIFNMMRLISYDDLNELK